jgi:NTP pyrophosphatase (non-canonical NTP hydrolase)
MSCIERDCISDQGACFVNIKELIKESHKNAVERGFYPEGEEKNIGELLMLIVSELGEALEAHRCGKFADWKEYNRSIKEFYFTPEGSFKKHIKDTFEDELADVFIRIFDLYGYLERTPELSLFMVNTENIPEMLFQSVGYLTMYQYDAFLCFMIAICKKLNIPIEKHIRAKMAYNKTRPHKHGKEY